jgi:hypothetical protein|eukprot:m.165249 g.165249  ORF g.165249 m.165249 type:complete len:152 (+) comp23988_c0_seq1:222-677(+)
MDTESRSQDSISIGPVSTVASPQHAGESTGVTVAVQPPNGKRVVEGQATAQVVTRLGVDLVINDTTTPTAAQRERYERRRRALDALLGLAGREAVLVLGGPDGVQTTQGRLESWAADDECLHVSALGTPLGTVPKALLRGSDVVQATFDLP